MKCSKCGAQLPDGARFCDQCGQVLGPPPMARPAPQPPPGPPPGRPVPAPPSASPGPPRMPDPAPRRAEEPPPVWSPPPARPAAAPGGRPAMPRPPQLPSTPPPPPSSAPAETGQPFPPPLPYPAKPDQPAATAPQDPGQWFAPQRAPTAPAPEVGLAADVTLVLVETNSPFVLSGSDHYLIGREDPEEGIYPDLDLTLSGGEEAGVSRRHATLSYRNGAYWLEDLDSFNYTFINGARIEPKRPQPLRDGDEVWFGKLRMRFHQGRGASSWR